MVDLYDRAWFMSRRLQQRVCRRIAPATSPMQLLSVACSNTAGDVRSVELVIANHRSPENLADSSEYLLLGTVVSSPTLTIVARDLGLAYMESDVHIHEVIAQRPDVCVQLASGSSIRVGVSMLDVEQNNKIVNFDDLANQYPTTLEALAKGENVLLFLAGIDSLDSSRPEYAAAGYGIIGKGGKITWKGFPGDLAGTKSDLEATRADVTTRYSEPAPWRQPTEEPMTRPDVEPVAAR